MLLTEDQKPGIDTIRDDPNRIVDDLPPAYDALPLHHSTSRRTVQHASSSFYCGPVAGPELNGLHDDMGPTNPKPFVSNVHKLSPPRPSSIGNTPALPRNTNSVVAQVTRNRKSASWFSLLPFVSSISAKRVRQSVLSVIGDLVVPPSRVTSREQQNVHELLASIAETCIEHKLSLSAILQEPLVADHTPMYWAIVNYRQELLVALLIHSRPLTTQAISDIRRACLVSSNQTLFQALRVCRPPFHRTEGLQAPSLRVATDTLLLGDCPLDDIQIQQSTDHGCIVSFVIPLWQKRMRAIGQVAIEFIVSGRMWSVTWFSTDPSRPPTESGKQKTSQNTWHVTIGLLESSPPTFLDSKIIIDVLGSNQPLRLQEARSTLLPPSGDKHRQSQSSMYDHNYDGMAHSRYHNTFSLSGEDRSPLPSFSKLPPPVHPMRSSPSSLQLRNSTAPPISIRLGSGTRKLGRRGGSGDPAKAETPTTKPDTWSDHGVGYTNAIVAPLCDGPASQLIHEHSRYLLPDGTLRGRLEARFVQSETSKECIIC